MWVGFRGEPNFEAARAAVNWSALHQRRQCFILGCLQTTLGHERASQLLKLTFRGGRALDI